MWIERQFNDLQAFRFNYTDRLTSLSGQFDPFWNDLWEIFLFSAFSEIICLDELRQFIGTKSFVFKIPIGDLF